MEASSIKQVLSDRRNEAAIGVFAVAVALGLGLYLYASSSVESQSANYSTYANVTEPGENISVGIETGEGMDFGRLVEGTNMTKTLELGAGNDTLTYVEVSTEGNISEYLDFDQAQLFMNSTDIAVMMEGRKPGYYEGTILLDIKTAVNNWGERWLELVYQLQ